MAPVEGLSQSEIVVLAVIAGSSFLPSNPVSAYSAKQDAERAGITNMGFNIGVRRLVTKSFIKLEELQDENNGERYDGIRITESGWTWIDANESRFVLHRQSKNSHALKNSGFDSFDDIAF